METDINRMPCRVSHRFPKARGLTTQGFGLARANGKSHGDAI